MAKRTHFGILHIKRNTEGTSNELSLSVLDAKKNQADALNGDVPVKDDLGKIPLFTLGGKQKAKKSASAPAAAAAIVSRGKGARSTEKADEPSVAAPSHAHAAALADPNAEILRRKRRRRGVRIANVIGAIAVLAVVAAVATSYIGKQNAAHQTGSQLLNDTIDMIEQSDTTIVAMDEALASPVDGTALSDMQGLLNDLPSTSSILSRAANKAAEASASASDNSQAELAAKCMDSIDARQDLITQGTKLMTTDVAAKRAVDALNSAWNDVLAGDVKARAAARLVSDTTEANVSQSITTSNEAIALFKSAREAIGSASTAFPSANLTLLQTYVDKRIEAQQYALASDTAILQQDKSTAESNNAAANASDTEAAAIAKRLPDNVAQPILDAYANSDTSTREAYSDARDRAAAADAHLRDYLGTSAK